MKGERTAVHVLIIVFNFTAILITVKTPQLIKVRSHKIFVSILFCHLLYGFVDLVWEFKQTIPLTALNFYFVHCGLCCMIMLTIDRIYAIKFPFRYKESPTWVTILMISSCFVLPLVVLVLQMTFLTPRFTIQSWTLMALIVFCIVGLTSANLLLYIVSVKHMRSAKRQVNSVRQNYPKRDGTITDTSAEGTMNPGFTEDSPQPSHTLNSSNADDSPDQSKVEPVPNKVKCKKEVSIESTQRESAPSLGRERFKRRRSSCIRLRKEVRAAYMCIRLVLSFTIMTLPWLVERIMRYTTGYKNEILWRVALFLTASNSVVDPVMYILFNRELRGEMHKRVCCCCKKSSSLESSFNKSSIYTHQASVLNSSWNGDNSIRFVNNKI